MSFVGNCRYIFGINRTATSSFDWCNIIKLEQLSGEKRWNQENCCQDDGQSIVDGYHP